MTYVPMPPSSSAPAATPMSAVTWSWTRLVIASTLMPALTRPMVPPSTRIGVTARTEGPRLPVYVSVKERPARAGPMCPRKCRPIRVSSGWVQRMPRGSMIVTKSTSVSRCTWRAYGWSRSVGWAVPMASWTDGASATERATAIACRPAASSAWLRSLTYVNSAYPATRTAISTACMPKSWPARLRGRGTRGRRMPFSVPRPRGRSTGQAPRGPRGVKSPGGAA